MDIEVSRTYLLYLKRTFFGEGEVTYLKKTPSNIVEWANL